MKLENQAIEQAETPYQKSVREQRMGISNPTENLSDLKSKTSYQQLIGDSHKGERIPFRWDRIPEEEAAFE